MHAILHEETSGPPGPCLKLEVLHLMLYIWMMVEECAGWYTFLYSAHKYNNINIYNQWDLGDARFPSPLTLSLMITNHTPKCQFNIHLIHMANLID